MRIKSAVGITAIAAMAACFACKGKETPVQEITAVVKTETASAVKTPYSKKGTYFNLPAVTGGQIDLASYAGKPVLFMLFTETCPYCRRAAPALEKLHKTYGPKGLIVLGLCTEDEARAAKQFADDLGITFPLAYSARPVYQQYKAQGVPYIFLLNAAHEVVTVWPGYDNSFYREMEKTITTELDKKTVR